MKILVLSDSHSALSFMRRCIDSVKPDVVFHLGDYVADGESMSEEYPNIRFYQVAGNCDYNRVPPDYPEILLPVVDGVRFYMTHGHRHGVKQYQDKLILDARKSGADVALYGHTHCADCRKLEDGLWVLNPGSCGYYGGTAGLIVIESHEVQSCQIIDYRALEDMK